MSRIDIIGQNGPEGLHYETEHRDKLIADHWNYIENMLRVSYPEELVLLFDREELIQLIKFHYKSAGVHFWKHAFEHMEEQRT